jgi:hypothetical protein|tara:strand:+ start:394 stop:636 length:243 start_codon:yes stop_codon:yes gene_type:complete
VKELIINKKAIKMKKTKVVAQKNCANYNTGKCLGIMFTRINGKLRTVADKNFVGKDCSVEQGNCGYFNNIVVKGITNYVR